MLQEVKNKPRIKKIAAIFLAVVIFACSVFLVKPVLQKYPVFIFRHAPFVVTTSSMEPALRTNSLVIIKQTPLKTLKTGDVIAFRSDALGGRLALHRISRITENGIYTKGDGNNFEDNQAVGEKDYVGKCVFHSPAAGGFLRAFSSLKGIALLSILSLAAAAIIFSVRLIKKSKT